MSAPDLNNDQRHLVEKMATGFYSLDKGQRFDVLDLDGPATGDEVKVKADAWLVERGYFTEADATEPEPDQREQMRAQIQSIAYDGALMVDNFHLRGYLQSLRPSLIHYVGALEAKIERIANIAEAGEPDEDWETVSGEDAGDPDDPSEFDGPRRSEDNQSTLDTLRHARWRAYYRAHELVGGQQVVYDDEVETVIAVNDWSESPFPDTASMVGVVLDRGDSGSVERAIDRNAIVVVITGPTMAERAEEAMRQEDGEPFLIVGVFRDQVKGDGTLRRFAEEYASATGWEGAEAAALEEHPTLEVAAVLEVEDGKVRVCGLERE